MTDIYIECGYGERSAKVGVFDILNTLFDSGITVREVSRPLNLIRTTNVIIHAVPTGDNSLIGNEGWKFDINNDPEEWINYIKEKENMRIKLWDI